MLSFIDLCDIIQTSKEVILLVPQESYIELARKMREDKSKVFSMFHTTVSTPIFELIRNQASVADAYDTLKKSYQLDTYVEQQNLRVKINKLYIGKLQSYLDNFEQHLAEYTSIGGSRQDTALYDTFVRHISGSKYKIYYNMYHGSTIDELLAFFRPIAEKESLDIGPHAAPKQGRTNNTKRTPLYANKVALQRAPNGKPLRCRRCNGWGHEVSMCALDVDVCHFYGEPGHFRKDCPNNQQRNKANKG